MNSSSKENVVNVLCKKTEKIGEVLVSYTIRHLYAKASYADWFFLIKISSAMGQSTEVHYQNYARFIPDGTADLSAKHNARVA